MSGANAKWKSAVSRARRPASRRPKTGTQVTQHATTVIGGGDNAVAGFVHPNNTTDRGRNTLGGKPL